MKTQRVGKIGELLASKFLKSKGFTIIEQNYRKKWGELDIIAKKGEMFHFVEVKAISIKGDYMPEDNVRTWKKERMSRAIRTYIIERRIPNDTEFEIDIIAVFLDFALKKARIRMLENVNL